MENIIDLKSFQKLESIIHFLMSINGNPLILFHSRRLSRKESHVNYLSNKSVKYLDVKKQLIQST